MYAVRRLAAAAPVRPASLQSGDLDYPGDHVLSVEVRRSDGLSGQMEQLDRYILRCYTDAEEQVKVYPHCAWLLGQLYLEQDRVEEAYITCKKGKASLVENGSLSPLWEILELEETCLVKWADRTN